MAKRSVALNKKKKGKRLFFYIPFWALLVFSFGSVILTQMERRDRYLLEQRRLINEIESQKSIADDLRDQLRYNKSDYYIEKIAREQLGLVYPDEYIFSTN